MIKRLIYGSRGPSHKVNRCLDRISDDTFVMVGRWGVVSGRRSAASSRQPDGSHFLSHLN